jgi:hypothetical protein
LRTNPHPRLRAPDRVLWVWLRCLWPEGWRQHLSLVQPETVLRWHRKGWRLYWTWKSRTQLGRPHLIAEVRELIARISHENPHWGCERIRGELLKLGIVVSNRSIRRYRWRKPRPAGSQGWRTFLSNQLCGIWASDLFVVQTLTFRTLYVFFFIRPSAARAAPLQRHRQSNRCLDLAAAPGGHALEPGTQGSSSTTGMPSMAGTLTVSWRVWASPGCGPRPGRQMPTPWASESCGRSGPSVSIT